MSRKMYLPKHKGTQVGVNGVTLEADEDGMVNVPDDAVTEMKGHGLVDTGDPVALEAALKVDFPDDDEEGTGEAEGGEEEIKKPAAKKPAAKKPSTGKKPARR